MAFFERKFLFLLLSIIFISSFIPCVWAAGEKELNAAMVFGPDNGGSLDPAYKWVGWYVRETGLYETLFSNDATMTLQPELAAGYTQLSPTKWEIKLRNDVKFHDGTPFNADAAVYSLKRVISPDNDRSSEYSFISDISKSGEYSIIITTKEPYTPVIASLSDPICSMVSPSATDLKTHPVGTGPFMFDSFESGKNLRVSKNPSYWDGEVLTDKVNFQYNKDPIARSLMLQSGDVDIARNIPQADADTINSEPGLETMTKETLRTYFCYINGAKAPFDDIRVRQALNYAINRDEIVNTALEGIGGKPANGPFPSILPWSANSIIPGYSYNPDQALSLLKEAGITEDNQGKLMYNGKQFSIEIQTYGSRPELQPTAEAMAAQLEKLGIKATVKIADTNAIQADMSNGNYDLALYAWGVAPSGDPDYFCSKQFLSTSDVCKDWTHYKNPTVDDLINKARSITNYDDRWNAYADIQKQVVEDSPEIFVFYQNEIVGKKTDVKGYEIYPSEITFMTKNVYVD